MGSDAGDRPRLRGLAAASAGLFPGATAFEAGLHRGHALVGCAACLYLDDAAHLLWQRGGPGLSGDYAAILLNLFS